MLTHVDANGNDSPAVIVDNTTAANRAVNIPEFLNVPQGGLEKIDPQATEFYRLFNDAYKDIENNQIPEAIQALRGAGPTPLPPSAPPSSWAGATDNRGGFTTVEGSVASASAPTSLTPGGKSVAQRFINSAFSSVTMLMTNSRERRILRKLSFALPSERFPIPSTTSGGWPFFRRAFTSRSTSR